MMGTKHADSCRDNAADDEPLFTLRAHDKYAPVTVLYWADQAEQAGAPAEKVVEARACANRMLEWQMENGAKVPD